MAKKPKNPAYVPLANAAECGFDSTKGPEPHPWLVDIATQSPAGDVGTLIEQLMYQPMLLPAAPNLKESRYSLWLPGHFAVSQIGEYGPVRQSDIVVVGEMPGEEEIEMRRNFVGPAGRLLWDCLDAHGFDYSNVYLTNVMRFYRGSQGIRVAWIALANALLWREFCQLQPKYVLCLGSRAYKAVTGDRSKITAVRGNARVYDSGLVVFPTVHPSYVARMGVAAYEHDSQSEMFSDLRRFIELTGGQSSKKPDAEPIQYVVVESLPELRQLLDAHSDAKEIALDCEWGGGDKISSQRLRSVQIAWSRIDATVLYLRDEELEDVFEGGVNAALCLLAEWVKERQVGLIGHNIASDLAALLNEGVDLRTYVSFDTMYAAHVLQEQGPFALTTSLAQRYADMPPWGRAASEAAESDGDIDYARVPKKELVLYGARDAIATWRTRDGILNEQRRRQEQKNEHYDFTDYTGRTQNLLTDIPPRLARVAAELWRWGFYIDRALLYELSSTYYRKRDELRQEAAEMIGWEVSVTNHEHIRRLLFASQSEGGLGLSPVKTTGDNPRAWRDVVDAGDQDKYVPAADTATIEELYFTADASDDAIAVLRKLLDLKAVDQMCRTLLADPSREPGKKAMKSSLLRLIDTDNRVRAQFYPTTVSGRWRSRPNMQNMPKAKQQVLDRIFGMDSDGKPIVPPIRRLVQAPPGYRLVAADYETAELTVLAVLSNDAELMSLLASGRKPHSIIAKKEFKLDCEECDVSTQYPKEYIAAKRIIFGMCYGRTARALARDLRRFGIDVTEQQAQNVIDAFFQEFRQTQIFLASCRACVTDAGYYRSPFGRYRRFTGTETALWREQRQAMNIPMQSVVADVMNLGQINLVELREQLGMNEQTYRLVGTIHDESLSEVHESIVEHYAKEIAPLCLSDMAPIPGYGATLSADVEISESWM